MHNTACAVLLCPGGISAYKRCMLTLALFAQTATQAAAEPGFFGKFGIMLVPLLLLSAGSLAVIVERLLHYHREQINSIEFLNGVRNVLKSNNSFEAVAICEATPGPVSRLVKAAILNREHGRERLQEALEEVGLTEVPRLEANLSVLATFAQIGPLVGLLGTLLGFVDVFRHLQASQGAAAPAEVFRGVWQSLYAASGGIAIAIVCYAAYNYLVSRVNAIVLDMEKASGEAARLVLNEPSAGPSSR
jgi:biopolymer transport protein ExbB